ncbi:MAG: glycosyltransferase family 4 protein [Sulfuritalea sp.]|nr:glycosyltransferase family 4 protein [Sulfuritalea sp.]
MKLLLVHQNFPAQFGHIAAHFAADPGHRVIAIGESHNIKRAIASRQLHPGIELHSYPEPHASSGATHRYLLPYEAAVRRGLETASLASQIKARGFTPDLIVAHPGWGEALFMRDVFPEARLVLYGEYYYHAAGADVGFDPEFPSTPDDAFRIRMKNTTQWMSMQHADLLLTPTNWQKSRFPELIQPRMRVVHDGIDTRRAAPDSSAGISLRAAGISLGADDEIVTYVARNLEPYRGFHIFLRSLPALLKRRPKARVLIVGGDQVSYGSKPADGRTWRRVVLDEVGGQLDSSRVHFLGRVAYADYLRLLQISTVHVYLTYPFVLSWSLLEAMSAGCMVIGSRTAPVEEVIRHGENGWLVDFFDHQALAEKLAEAIEQRDQLAPVRAAARKTVVDGYDLQTRCLPRQVALLQAVLGPGGAGPA